MPSCHVIIESECCCDRLRGFGNSGWWVTSSVSRGFRIVGRLLVQIDRRVCYRRVF